MLPFKFDANEGRHFRFITDAKLVVDAIMAKLNENNSIFKDYLGQLNKTASFINQIDMDMPVIFEIFVPIRLPLALKATFNEAERTVVLTKPNFIHPFFFANAVNSKCINVLLRRDLERAISSIVTVPGKWGANYDLKYQPLSFNITPFGHQIFAMERGKVNCGLRFDFIMALEFNGAEVPLPAYFNTPISHKWFAYGLVAKDPHYNASDLGVLVPRWLDAEIDVRLRSHNMILLLHRLLYAQRCYSFAVPFLLKFSFCMTTVQCGEEYKSMSFEDLLLTTLGHQIFQNFCELLMMTKVRHSAVYAVAAMGLRVQQMRGRDLFAMLSKGFQMNVISSQFIMKYFKMSYLMLALKPSTESEIKKEQEKLRRKRRHSI